MTLAAVLTVAVSLALVGGALLIKQSASQASVVWQQQTRVTIWMKPHATNPEINAVKTQLNSSPYVKGTCQYLDKMANYRHAKILLTPADFAHLTVEDMPTSFTCEPSVPSDISIITSTFTGQPGVYQVTGPVKQVKQMEATIRVVQYVLLTLAVVLLISAVVLILNTIRLAIFSRRREVNVMKLVGATNWFIRIPFITEGFIQGLLGSFVAVLAVTALHTWYPLSQEFQLPAADLIGTNIVVIILGVAIGSIGSAFAIRRFLDV
jgi:cell division transport system permease protein